MIIYSTPEAIIHKYDAKVQLCILPLMPHYDNLIDTCWGDWKFINKDCLHKQQSLHN